MRTLTKVLVAFALVCSSPIVSAAPGGAHAWESDDWYGCDYLIGHLTNPYGYPIAVTEHHSSGCHYWKQARLWSESGLYRVHDRALTWGTYSPAIAVGPFGFYPDFSTHKVCPDYGPCYNDAIT
jgi:hypothetical protein